MPETYYTVGVIAGTHGLQGEVKVLSKTDFVKRRFKSGSHLFLRKEGEQPSRELVVASARPHKQFWLVSFADLPSINDVEWMKGLQLCVPESGLTPLPKGSYYIHQLVGLQVRTDDGRDVGQLVEVLTPGANDVYVIRGALQQKDVLIPAIRDCILDVDPDAGTMLVHLLPGLLDADETPESADED